MFYLIKRVLGAVFKFIEIFYKFKMLRKDFRNIFAQMEEYVILYSKCCVDGQTQKKLHSKM